ncbi:hypothetical protein [Azospirillum griseum]|uniref:Intracellular sulfur oxidation protein, DsrE/DsrF family n=1 Tax=Azospirillum griseum TaxID=2496639 RepID=A0A431VCK3_9PROT|nr:hypothetical protein [Azospirillum griseum]RTR16446.1 hypothetical protein EJ903_20845 [Azospirillum griseum]
MGGEPVIRLVIHAPTPGALERGRRNAANLLKLRPDAAVRLVVNGAAVVAALDHPDPATDGLLRLCANSLRAAGRDAGALTVVVAAVLDIATAQAEGWAYLRA